MKRVYWLISAIILSLFYFCDKDNCLNGKKIPEGAYAYMGYDSIGIKIVEGWISFDFVDSTTISGEWELDKIGDPKNIGPQVGTGQLGGNVQNSQIYLNLNPNFIDNNIFLASPYDNHKLEGEWTYAGFPGVINYGSFVAEKN